MDQIKALKCVLCGKEYSPGEVEYTCPACGPEGILEVLYDYELISRRISPRSLKEDPDFSIWRYKPLLPVREDSPIPPLHVGWTPLYRPRLLNEKLGFSHLFIKDEGRNPTASLKDRASAVGIVKALEKGAREVTCASTGNAASSWAGAAASVGLKSYIFVPQTAPRAKLAQLLIFGATIFPVKGSYDQAFDLCIQASSRFGWYNRNTAFNPYLVEGKKTVALEIAEQLAWKAPDKVFVSVGDGCILSGVFKGFADLLNLGWIDRFPQIIGVQAEGASPLYRAWKEGKPFEPVEPVTIADSISVGIPRNRVMALRDLKTWKGLMMTVTDDEILEAMRVLGRQSGVFGEPAGVASLAGLIKASKEGIVQKEEAVVVIISGNGLKDISSALKAVRMPEPIEPSLSSVEEYLKKATSFQ
ncbi:MAG: threonine synthase [Caldiserica bacterium]|jgi:threonine synthase|nr:threonine synthase [Caldisericota bacterium]MDH7562036.1 threonine synthase [Caldisericota bacterium]